MRLDADGKLRLSPTDLGNHLACAHLTQLELRVQRGELERPHVDDPYGRIIMDKGNEHEGAYLARLEADGLRIARMRTYEDEGFDAEQARRATEDAIRAGEADVIYQAYLSDGTWRGFADFLERQPDGTHEPVDTKLARSAKPLHLLQLCFYAEQLGRIQGRLPEHVHVELGTGVRETFRTAEFIAFFRRSPVRLKWSWSSAWFRSFSNVSGRMRSTRVSGAVSPSAVSVGMSWAMSRSAWSRPSPATVTRWSSSTSCCRQRCRKS